MPISYHFLDCKALLITSLTHVGLSDDITSVQTFTLLWFLPDCVNMHNVHTSARNPGDATVLDGEKPTHTFSCLNTVYRSVRTNIAARDTGLYHHLLLSRGSWKCCDALLSDATQRMLIKRCAGRQGQALLCEECTAWLCARQWHHSSFLGITARFDGYVAYTCILFFWRIRIAYTYAKGPFIATQLNSTQLDVELSCVAINGP